MFNPTLLRTLIALLPLVLLGISPVLGQSSSEEADSTQTTIFGGPPYWQHYKHPYLRSAPANTGLPEDDSNTDMQDAESDAQNSILEHDDEMYSIDIRKDYNYASAKEVNDGLSKREETSNVVTRFVAAVTSRRGHALLKLLVPAWIEHFEETWPKYAFAPSESEKLRSYTEVGLEYIPNFVEEFEEWIHHAAHGHPGHEHNHEHDHEHEEDRGDLSSPEKQREALEYVIARANKPSPAYHEFVRESMVVHDLISPPPAIDNRSVEQRYAAFIGDAITKNDPHLVIELESLYEWKDDNDAVSRLLL